MRFPCALNYHFFKFPSFVWQCPPTLQQHEFLGSHDGAASTFAAGLLVDLNLQTSIPDSYRPPPAPIPYDVVLGPPRSTDCDSDRGTIAGSNFESLAICEGLKVSDCKTQASSLPTSPRKFELPKSNEPNFSLSEEDDACPICLEGAALLESQEANILFILPFLTLFVCMGN